MLFSIIPVVELAILIKIGTLIGTLNTIAIVVFTALLGAYLVRREGLSVAYRLQRNLQQGIFPAEELIDGALILVSGALLLTPGVLTDIAGFTMVLAPSRRVIKKYLKGYLKKRFVVTPL